MDRILFDIPRWNIYLHRRERKLRLVTPRDPALLKFEDELFHRLYGDDKRLLPEKRRDKKAELWAERAHEMVDALPNFAEFSAACHGRASEAAQATQAIMDIIAPKITAPTQQQKKSQAEAEDASQGLGQVQLTPEEELKQQEAEEKKRVAHIAELIKDDERLKKIALLAGRFKRVLLTKQKAKVKHDQDELADIEQGGEISRLLPQELVKLLSPRLKSSMLRDLLERKCLQYSMQAQDHLGRGPVVLCVDKSGSMAGEKDIWATAICLALLDMAQRQKRVFIILGFDDVVFQKVIVKPGKKLPMEQLCVAPRGGTDIWNALMLAVRAANTKKVMRRADIILITDGECSTSEAPELREMAKEADVSILGIGIGLKPEAVLPWCDEAFSVTDMGSIPDDVAQAMFGK